MLSVLYKSLQNINKTDIFGLEENLFISAVYLLKSGIFGIFFFFLHSVFPKAPALMGAHHQTV